jgi:isoquinoline 1-oxidoreductase alpha subunit
MTKLQINGVIFDIEVEDNTPLLWVLREQLGLTGSKYACGIGQCGACTVLVRGKAVPSCLITVDSLTASDDIVTIEGLSKDGSHPLQQAFAELDTPQCGYCIPGMIMRATALLNSNTDPSDAVIDATMTNICRCGTYGRVRRGIRRAAEIMQQEKAR